MNKPFAERLAEVVAGMVILFGIAYVLWHVHQAAIHHAFEAVTR